MGRENRLRGFPVGKIGDRGIYWLDFHLDCSVEKCFYDCILLLVCGGIVGRETYAKG